MLTVVLILLLAASVAFTICVYPHRVVLSIMSVVPTERLVACLRLRNAGALLRGCAGSAFAEKVRRGDIYPIRELLAKDEKLREKWQGFDASYWPEVFGRDCVVALYGNGAGHTGGVAVWSRIGFRVRLFYFWQRARAYLFFWKKKELAIRREGRLVVTTVLDDEGGKPRFSYVLVGDLGIATLGSGMKFWRSVNAFMNGERRKGSALPGEVFEDGAPGDDGPRGALYVDSTALYESFGPQSVSFTTKSGERCPLSEGLRDYLRDEALKWKGIEGRFSLGSRVEGEFVVRRGKGASFAEGDAGVRNPAQDPLAGPMESGGFLYAGSRYGCKGVVSRVLGEAKKEGMKVEFVRPGKTTRFRADHFSLSWLGEDFSFILCRSKSGMPNAALRFSVSDRRMADERIERFLGIADGAEIRLVEGSGKRRARTKQEISVERRRFGDKSYYTISSGSVVERFYKAVLSLDDDCLIVASSEDLMESVVSGSEKPSGGWMKPAAGQLVIRGSRAMRAAASMKQILMIVTAFTKKSGERARLRAVGELLGICDWLAPLREAWITARNEGGDIHLRVGADVEDIGG
jgi:hypothetical protein